MRKAISTSTPHGLLPLLLNGIGRVSYQVLIFSLAFPLACGVVLVRGVVLLYNLLLKVSYTLLIWCVLVLLLVAVLVALAVQLAIASAG